MLRRDVACCRQRHLPYLWAFPEFEVQKLQAWGSWAQGADGRVAECLAGFGHGPLDQPTGRAMGDTTSLFVLEVFELWRQGADTAATAALLQSLYPSVRKAVQWMVANAAKDGYNLPQYLTTTYDHFGWERQRGVVYNAHIYLVSLRAGQELAKAAADAETEARARVAIALAQAAVVSEDVFWNASR